MTNGECTVHTEECACDIQRFWLAQVTDLSDLRNGFVNVWWLFAKKEFGYYNREYYEDDNGKRNPYMDNIPVATGINVMFVMYLFFDFQFH